jgi:hypothetical protein
VSYESSIYSATAIRYNIDNIPSEKSLQNMITLAENVIEPICKKFKVSISSFYRSPKLNKLVGGSKNSQHQALKGAAVDIISIDSKYSNKDIFNWVLDNLEFDQLIWEFGDTNNPAWVHISYNKNNNRNQVIYY